MRLQLKIKVKGRIHFDYLTFDKTGSKLKVANAGASSLKEKGF